VKMNAELRFKKAADMAKVMRPKIWERGDN
jgi:hypothetical protein